MQVVFLGAFTENKKFLILSMAQILSMAHTVKVFTNSTYDYEEKSCEVTDFCRVEVHEFADETQLLDQLNRNACDFAFIDIDRVFNPGSNLKILSVCDPERSSFEKTMQLTLEFTRLYPFTDIAILYTNTIEYCKINKPYLEKIFERSLKGSVNITKSFELYFDERNAAIILESMYKERLLIKNLTTSWKMQLLAILQDLSGLEIKKLKGYLKKAERVK